VVISFLKGVLFVAIPLHFAPKLQQIMVTRFPYLNEDGSAEEIEAFDHTFGFPKGVRMTTQGERKTFFVAFTNWVGERDCECRFS
jgi:hypothetical protein